MRIIRQADSTFRYHNPGPPDERRRIMDEDEWYDTARLNTNIARNLNYSIDQHEAASDAHRLGFVTAKDIYHRLYKVDEHDIVHEIYPRGRYSDQSDDEVRAMKHRWMMKVSNIPETPDVISAHATLDDAIEHHRKQAWKRGIKKPSYQNHSKEMMESPPGTNFITSPFARMYDPLYQNASGDPQEEGTAMATLLEERQKNIQHFHDAWNEGTHNPYERQSFK